jgi:hypothetical protein
MTSESQSRKDASGPPRRANVEWRPLEFAGLRVTRVVGRPYAAIERDLRIRPEQALRIAYGQGGGATEATISLADHPSLSWLRVPVRVASFTPSGDHHGFISIRWTPTRLMHVLPTMDADVSAIPHTSDECELVLDGKYRPPLGFVGFLVDRLFGRWVASRTAATFVDRLAEGLEERSA